MLNDVLMFNKENKENSDFEFFVNIIIVFFIIDFRFLVVFNNLVKIVF